jgi:glycosyltransferase involved in cell wall biosynthesis
MLVSIVTPSYDRGKFHPILSRIVQDQTYKEIEHVVVEERESFDRHGIMVEGAKHIIVDQPRLLMHEKRNLCCEYASGDIIINFDSDDYYRPQYVEEIMKHFNRYQKAITHSILNIYVLKKKLYYISTRSKPYWGSGALYPKSLWEELKYLPATSNTGEDTNFFSRIHKLNKLFPTDFLYLYTIAMRHGENITVEVKRGRVVNDEHHRFLKEIVVQPEILKFYMDVGTMVL